jgi:hypothetical protein
MINTVKDIEAEVIAMIMIRNRKIIKILVIIKNLKEK